MSCLTQSLRALPGGFSMVWGPQVAVLGVVVVHDGHGGDVFAVDKLGIIITIVRHFSIIVANSSSPEKYKSCTGKSLSEAPIFASTNPQYDDRLFIELQVQYMKIPSSNLGRTCCVQKLFPTFRTIFVHNMFSPCSTKRKASDKDLPVKWTQF